MHSERSGADEWDFTSSETHAPVAHPTAVVTVEFADDEFELVARRARSMRLPITAFVRSWALDASTAQPRRRTA